MPRNVLDIGNGDTLENVGKSCYLSDMLNADGGVDLAVVARVGEGEEVQSSLKLKGKVYGS